MTWDKHPDNIGSRYRVMREEDNEERGVHPLFARLLLDFGWTETNGAKGRGSSICRCRHRRCHLSLISASHWVLSTGRSESLHKVPAQRKAAIIRDIEWYTYTHTHVHTKIIYVYISIHNLKRMMASLPEIGGNLLLERAVSSTTYQQCTTQSSRSSRRILNTLYRRGTSGEK
jgi:hypothetical protein